MIRKLELLAPAKNLKCGIAAIDCGADAVYIGAPKFGARAAAGNSIEDIKELIHHAHQFNVKVYLTLNTIIYDNELDDVRELLSNIYNIGLDAILVQDMAILELIESLSKEVEGEILTLHASTQTDNRNKEKVSWLKSLGFSRVVLARELSLDEIREIHEAEPGIELEAFVHGALCVSYSGACYASESCFGRSANRGECAQFCRMKFDLIDYQNKEIEHQRHLLSLKDMSQIEHLEELADAGVVSFKIEGRLKDETYVKNVVAAYSQRLNRICDNRSNEYERASLGEVTYGFVPNLKKTFNRGYTDYFFNGRKSEIFSPDTPKAIGEYVGKVKEIQGRSFNVAGTANFSNGDGLCFLNDNKELMGFRVNRAENNRIYPLVMPKELKPNMELYRNNDVAFEKELFRPGTERKIPISLIFSTTVDGFSLTLKGRGINTVKTEITFEHQLAKKPQRDNIITQLSKWGNTIYTVEDVKIEGDADKYFIPSSTLSTLRQNIFDLISLKKVRQNKPKQYVGVKERISTYSGFDYANVSNQISRELHKLWGVTDYHEAFEVNRKDFDLPLMQCRHCIRYSLGYCVKHGGRKPEWKEPLLIRLGDGRRFKLEFDCKVCQMNIYEE